MIRTILKGILLAILLALLQGKPILATECPQNAATPKSVTVIYDPDVQRRREVVFKPGADGVLHAVDIRSGGELWTYTPAGIDITHLADGLMTDVRALRFDADSNGSIDPAAGDKVWLYFGMRRGGRNYYALDVTDSLHPQLLWKIGPAELPGVGETWSTPTLARVRVGGAAQNGEHFVLFLGGGYDEASALGNRIFMVDAASGELLWYAGGADLPLPQMMESIPARIAVLDTDGDGFADRLYAADLGGRVWRFDVWNGNPRSQLVTGGVLAALAGTAPADMRRFFNAPDVALVQRRSSAPYYNLALGSGNRAQPFELLTQDRFYSLRDSDPFAKWAQSAYDARVPITDADLPDVVAPESVVGWKLELRLNGGWSGEKVLAEALTIDGVVLFPSYRPISEAACSGENRIYALNLSQGSPALDFNDDHAITSADISTPLTQSGIAGKAALYFPVRPNPNDGGQELPPDAEPVPAALCKVGAEVLRLCVPTAGPLRTFWQRNSTD